MPTVKSKVLSVRLSLADLQSCFDLCALAGHQPAGASSAIAGALKILMSIQRAKGILPVYNEQELLKTLDRFVSKINPSTICSLEQSSKVDLACNLFFPPPSVETQKMKKRKTRYDQPPMDEADQSEEGLLNLVEESRLLEHTIEEERFESERESFALSQEFSKELAEAILEIEMEEEVNLLSKILL